MCVWTETFDGNITTDKYGNFRCSYNFVTLFGKSDLTDIYVN